MNTLDYWKPSIFSFVLVAAICIFAPVAMGADPPGSMDVSVSALPTGTGSWLATVGAILSTVLLIIQQIRGGTIAVLDKLHVIAKDCEPTIRLVHTHVYADGTPAPRPSLRNMTPAPQPTAGRPEGEDG